MYIYVCIYIYLHIYIYTLASCTFANFDVAACRLVSLLYFLYMSWAAVTWLNQGRFGKANGLKLIKLQSVDWRKELWAAWQGTMLLYRVLQTKNSQST